MKRRHFMGAALAPSFLSRNVLAGVGLAHAAPGYARHFYFFDDRFTSAILLAGEWAQIGDPVPVQGDVTALWTSELRAANKASPLALQGATTESFYFCLQRLLQESNHVLASSQRLDRYLHSWTLETTPR